MLDRLQHLESIVRSSLEPDAKQRKVLLDKVVEYSEQFLKNLAALPAYVASLDSGRGIVNSPIQQHPFEISEEPIDIAAALNILHKHVDSPGINPASGGHLGYIPGGGIYFSALGDYLADVMNKYAGVFFAGPGAARLENMLIDWMASIVGYPKTTGGSLTSGGSIGNLVGIVAARDAVGLRAKDVERSVIYLTSQAHHSVDKAIRIAGLKEAILRYIPVDEKFRMDVNALEEQISGDKKSGLNPWLVIVSAGTTDVGAVDPLEEVAAVCHHHKLWIHCDGAYGAFFVLCDEGKKILKGMEHSDSLVMDPHKGLFLPYGTGAILVRDKMDLYNAFQYQAAYLTDALNAGAELSPADLSPELTKHFRGLRMWLPLKLAGVAPFRAALEEKILLARYFYEKIQEIPGFEVVNKPDLSVVAYHYVPKRGDANTFNQQLLQEMQNDGRVFISGTTLNGKYVLRVAIVVFRTHKDTIDLALEMLKEKAMKLENEY
jgi:glutamate/tyrosine decarboxylase-like PLP-dependent enzyme